MTTFANSISALRAKLSGVNDDVGITVGGDYRIAATGPDGLVYARTPEVSSSLLARMTGTLVTVSMHSGSD